MATRGQSMMLCACSYCLAHICFGVLHHQAPLLMTGMRSRPPRFRSQQELEEQEAERARQEQFHAKPVE